MKRNNNQIKNKTEIVSTDKTNIIYNNVLNVMKNHIGQQNYITKKDLFETFYGTEKYNKYQQLYLWSKLLSTLSYIRKKTYCFIICEKTDNDYIFYVLKNKKDADVYINIANNKIKGMEYMKKRATEALKNKWYSKI